MDSEAHSYSIEPHSQGLALVWHGEDGQDQVVTAIEESAIRSDVFETIARRLNNHTRTDEILISDAYDQTIRKVMAGSGLSYYDALNHIFARGVNTVETSGSKSVTVNVEGSDIPATEVDLHFNRTENPEDENIEAWFYENDEYLLGHQISLEGLFDGGLPDGWKVQVADAKDDHVVVTKLQNPKDGFHREIGEVGRKYQGADCAGRDQCTWYFNSEHEARSFMEEAAPVAARMSDGFEMDYRVE